MNHILHDSVEVCNLKIPNAIWSASKSSAAQVSFEESEYHFILLRYIKADGDLPRNWIILTRSKRDVEASFTIRETREVITYFRRNARDSCLHCLSFLLIVRTGRIFTASRTKRVAPDSNRMFQHIAKFVHGTTIPLTRLSCAVSSS